MGAFCWEPLSHEADGSEQRNDGSEAIWALDLVLCDSMPPSRTNHWGMTKLGRARQAGASHGFSAWWCVILPAQACESRNGNENKAGDKFWLAQRRYWLVVRK